MSLAVPPSSRPGADAPTHRFSPAAAAPPPLRDRDRRPAISGFEILGELGRGGMGVVYRARQTALGRVVALKTLLPGCRAPEDVARFAREAQALAALRHPNIVQIYEIGEADGGPFFTMEYAEGATLAVRLAGQPQPPREAAALLETLARAVHAAHQRRIVHRDLKPANVLLAADGTPKITDFGLAKEAGGGPPLTQTGVTAGTPSYMAPEQVRGQAPLIGPACDIYALGVILYEMLTGRTPFLADSGLATMRLVLDQEPVPPRRLQPRCPRDLETACLKCLEKDPRRRYASAAALADDLRRFLDGRPTAARPVGAVERAAKWVRRQPALAGLAAAAALAVLLLVGAGVGVAHGLQLQHERDQIQSQKDEAERQKGLAEGARVEAEANRLRAEEQKALAARFRYFAEVGLARRALDESAMARARELLDRQPAELRGFEWHYLDRAAHAGLATAVGPSAIRAVAWSGDGRYVAEQSQAGLTLHDARTLKTLWTIPHYSLNAFSRPAFSPDGARLAIWQGQGFAVIAAADRRFVWGYANPPAPGPAPAAFSQAAFTGDGELLFLCNDGGVRVWSAAGAELPARCFRVEGFSRVFSPDGRYLAGLVGSHVELWDTKTGLSKDLGDAGKGFITTFAFSPDGRQLLSMGGLAGAPCAVRLWDCDGRRLVSARGDGSLHVLDAQDGHSLAAMTGSAGHIRVLAFSPDGERVLSYDDQSNLRVWDAATGQETLSLRREGAADATFTGDGRMLVSVGRGGLHIWDATPVDGEAAPP